jgi:hypothetical protein
LYFCSRDLRGEQANFNGSTTATEEHNSERQKDAQMCVSRSVQKEKISNKVLCIGQSGASWDFNILYPRLEIVSNSFHQFSNSIPL